MKWPQKTLASDVVPLTLKVYSVRSLARHRSTVSATAKGYILNQHLFQNPYYARPTLANGSGNNVFDLERHRADMTERFQKVDDIIERLSSDPRIALEAKAGR